MLAMPGLYEFFELSTSDQLISMATGATAPLYTKAPQVGFEPTTLRLTVTPETTTGSPVVACSWH